LAISLGAVGCLRKPVNESELVTPGTGARGTYPETEMTLADFITALAQELRLRASPSTAASSRPGPPMSGPWSRKTGMSSAGWKRS
jgi:hypothetical protein